MARIAGVNLPNEKRMEIALTYIYGIAVSTSRRLLKEAGIDAGTKAKELTSDQEARLRGLVEKMMVEGDLRRKIQLDVKRLQDIGSYRGYRHKRKLPCRGQRTRTNARTRRGKRKTGLSGRKKAEKK